MNDTAHNIVQLNQQTVYGSEVAFCIWLIGWCSSIAIATMAYIVVEGDLLQIFLTFPWLCFFRVLSSVVKQMPVYNSQRRGTVRILPN